MEKDLSAAQRKNRVRLVCFTCGEEFYVLPSRAKACRHFCSNKCRLKWSSERMKNEINVPGHSKGHKAPHLTAYNKAQNPKNTSEGWSQEQRNAARERNKRPCKKDTYSKLHGRHEHRVVAERMLGRALLPGEVVHHIDGDKHNNEPSNLKVFASQAEHAHFHAQLRQGEEGDDAK